MQLTKVILVSIACSFLSLWACADFPAAPTFQELMNPALFPDPQFGMRVESLLSNEGSTTVQTTGAIITVEADKGTLRIDQRIGHPRPLAELDFGGALKGVEVTHNQPGLVLLAVEQPAMTIRINGDSLVMVHVHADARVRVVSQIPPAWSASHLTNHLVADEWGAFGLFCSETSLDDRFDVYAEELAVYHLPADAVLWAAACPPKPYDWERSIRDNVVWHWSNQQGYPPDDDLRSWKAYGNIVLLQSEVLLWKDWNLEFVPRLGLDEFARVRKTVHDAGMRFIVYTSPYYFLKDTPEEPQALNSFEDFKGWPPGNPTGMNMGLFTSEIRKVMAEYKPDGLYFDGQYIANPAALYALAREARQIVGEEGILEWHSTLALGSGLCYLPQADAYVDFILRGEGRDGQYSSLDYLRYFVSGYNINNCIGVICNNGPNKPTQEMARDVLKVNARFHMIASWIPDAGIVDTLNEHYWPRLNADLRETVEREADARQAVVTDRIAAARLEHQALAMPPKWDSPFLRIDFDAMPDAEPVVSPANVNPFSISDGALQIHALAHTYAFLSIPVNTQVNGLVAKIRQGTDGGMSWGPAVLLRWADGPTLRAGTRALGELQMDALGVQEHGSSIDVDQWIWLRARWKGTRGVVERSADGEHFERAWSFDHGGALVGPPIALAVGKVPFNGEAKDHSEPGAAGDSAIDYVELYAD